jgi:hypothetical protein
MAQNYSCISFLLSGQLPNKMCVMKSLEWWNFALSSLHTQNMYNSGVLMCLGITHIFMKNYESGYGQIVKKESLMIIDDEILRT